MAVTGKDMVTLVEDRGEVLSQIFQLYDKDERGELSPIQVQTLHAAMRQGGISLPQTLASIDYVCVSHNCEESELIDLLQEMDRRYFLVKDLRWEFSMLDREHSDTISEEQARWFMQSVHGKRFSRRKWENFLRSRAVPRSGVCFAEIEVELCNIPSSADVKEEEEEARKQAEERSHVRSKEDQPFHISVVAKQHSDTPVSGKTNPTKEKLRKQREAEERRKARLEDERKRKAEEAKLREEELRRRDEELRLKEEEELRKKKEEEERKKREEDEEALKKKLEEEEEEKKRKRLEEKEREEQEQREQEELEEKIRREAEERKQRELEEAKGAEQLAKEAEEKEKEAGEELLRAQKALKDAQDAKSKKEAEELERIAKEKARANNEKKVRAKLKVAIKSRDKGKLEKGIKSFKDAKLKDNDMDLATAEKILKQVNARDGLKGAMSKREIEAIEKAMTFVKKNGFEKDLAPEMLEANKLLINLRRLERIRAEILELKQSTVAEIRSYSTPPIAVHHVMTATFLVLGHPEKETKVWKTVQALVGKTGKDGLKRRCLELNPDKLDLKQASRAKELLNKYELDEIRDVSAGAATFYCWATSMIEEKEARMEAKQREEEEKKQSAAAN